MQYKYFYTKRTAAKIRSFYRNVARKYRHTYSYEDMERNVRDAFFAIYAIERTLPRRRPTINLKNYPPPRLRKESRRRPFALRQK